jgi:phosphate transporter family protein
VERAGSIAASSVLRSNRGSLLLILVLVVLGALAFDFTNGFQDTANAVATSIATGALKPRVAVVMSAVLNFVGAFIRSASRRRSRRDREPDGAGWRLGTRAGAGGLDRGDNVESDQVVSDDSVEFESLVDSVG